ncbi:helix-turn-helix domain-containing protein [Streptomyces sp. CBMA156]|uniref:helix-turn-helix domain-containing protein n=1 Tax=Streptomyces sp. CBMA156 TaxID=1930280 RepID=UPI001661CD88|nr:helix-turn-helix transcriptional regulator [Streptomyces sp. CBMA156]MBD0672396.1 transcriptional regulator [Streptomyces sp. CBMA156]MBD0676072.1 transcriptional regulator [Streptomyces sp. CBMA156]
MTTRTMDPAQELAAFLRSRREALDPGRLGLPSHRRARRTPGLRREEVAELAGVSTDYVVRLEQGRGLRPSAEVLAALARALRLDASERDYLFDLAGRRRPGTTGGPAASAAPSLARLVGDLSPLPAMLLDHRYDVLAWTPEMARLLPGFEAVPPSRRNAMRLCLLHPAMRGFYADREQTLRDGIAHLRAAWAAHPEDRELSGLIDEFVTQDEDFARLWSEREVSVNGRGRKLLRHPVEGAITVDFEVLQPLQDPGLRLLVYRAADEESRAALDRLCAR